MAAYVKKIVPSLAWLRRLDTEGAQGGPIMRVQGEVTEGWEETTHLGSYIRWLGRFRCYAVQADGSISEYFSANLLLPGVAQDWLATHFHIRTVNTTIKGRTGRFYAPGPEPDPSDTDENSDSGEPEAKTRKMDIRIIAFVMDIHLNPPQPGKVSATGYEFGMVIVKHDPNYDPMQFLLLDAPPFAAGAEPAKLTDGTTIEGQAEEPNLPGMDAERPKVRRR